MMLRVVVAMLALCAAAAQAAPPDFDLGRMYRNGTGVAQDSARAFGLIEGAARDGHPAAMFIAAAMLAAGEGTQKDVARARHWLEASAEAEYPEAIQQLAMNFRDGAPGYVRDDERAAQLFNELAHAMKHRAHR